MSDERWRNDPVSERVKALCDRIGQTLVFTLTGALQYSDVNSWMKKNALLLPDTDQIRRLDLARELYEYIAKRLNADRAKKWFIDSNVSYKKITPVRAIRSDQNRDVRASAVHVVNYEQ